MRAMFTRVGLLLALLASPFTAQAVASIHAISYPQGQGRQFHVFARGPDNRLVSNDFDGTVSTWTDHGHPPGAVSVGPPSAVTFNDGGTQYIYAFTVTDQHRLVVRHWNGVTWQWSNQGGPELINSEPPSAITYVDESGNRRIYLFATTVGDTGARLVVNYWDGTTWNWADLGPNFGLGTWNEPHAITYVENGVRKIRVFVSVRMVGGPNLAMLTWTGTQWVWGTTGLRGIYYMAPVTFLESGVLKTYLFMKKDSSLFAYYWDGVSWKTEDLGVPSPDYFEDVSAVTYLEGGQRRIRVFGTWGFRLYSKVWNGSAWTWQNHHSEVHIAQHSPIAYADLRSGTPRIQLFASTSEGVKRNYWNGTSWQWFHHGNPP